MKTVYLHIGTHKTGSTSLQRWLRDNQSLLHENGFAVYRGLYREENHVELHMAALRYDRDTFAKQARPTLIFNEEYTAKIAAKVTGFISDCAEDNVVLSNESLSHLRHKDELEKLARIIGYGPHAIKIILYLRDKADYLKSYRTQLHKKEGRYPSKDFWSCLYIEDDTWMTDYDQLISVYRGAFGAENVFVIDYDKEMQKTGNIIPSFSEICGFDISQDDLERSEAYRYNPTLSADSEKKTGSNIFKRMAKLF